MMLWVPVICLCPRDVWHRAGCVKNIHEGWAGKDTVFYSGTCLGAGNGLNSGFALMIPGKPHLPTGFLPYSWTHSESVKTLE